MTNLQFQYNILSPKSPIGYRNFSLQFGQIISLEVTANPHLKQVVGCISPSGAPQARQLLSPTGFAEPQYSQAMRVSRSDKAWDAPSVTTVRSMIFHTCSLSC